MSNAAALWLTVAAFGVYHGLNPAMGWPLAVANGLSQRAGRAVFATLLPLGAGHLAAMAVEETTTLEPETPDEAAVAEEDENGSATA